MGSFVIRFAEIIQSVAIAVLLTLPILEGLFDRSVPGKLWVLWLWMVPVGIFASVILQNAKPRRAMGGVIVVILFPLLVMSAPVTL